MKQNSTQVEYTAYGTEYQVCLSLILEKLCSRHPVQRVVVDSGHESEENYHYVDRSEQLSLFVKPSNHEQKLKLHHKIQKGRLGTHLIIPRTA